MALQVNILWGQRMPLNGAKRLWLTLSSSLGISSLPIFVRLDLIRVHQY